MKFGMNVDFTILKMIEREIEKGRKRERKTERRERCTILDTIIEAAKIMTIIAV